MIETFYTDGGSDIEEKHEIKYYSRIETFYTDCGSDIEEKTWNKILLYDRNILYRLWQWYRGKNMK